MKLTVKDSLQMGYNAYFPHSDESEIKKTVQSLKDMGCDCYYEPSFTTPRPKLIFNDEGEVCDIQIQEKKLTGYIIFKTPG